MRQSEVKEIGKNRKRVFARNLEQVADGQMTTQDFLEHSFIKPLLQDIAQTYIEKVVMRLRQAKTRGQR